MRILWILSVAALMAAPSALAGLPLNSIENGDFEAGLSGWRTFSRYGGVQVVSPGADGSSGALLVENRCCGAYAYQKVPSLAASSQALVFDFHAKVVNTDASRTGLNIIEVISTWQQSTGSAQLTTAVWFTGAKVGFLAYGGAHAVTDAPADGEWHRYTAVLNGITGLGVLLVDGSPLLQATGVPASVAPPEWIIAGDVSSCDCGRPGPDVAYDQVWLGPQP